MVARGELIGRLKDGELKNRRDRAQLDLQIAKMTADSGVDVEYAQKSYRLAEAELQRAEQANARVTNSIPLARIEKMRLEKERTRLQLEQAERESRIVGLRSKLVEHEVRMTELQLAQSVIRAPVAGVVVSVEAHAGEWVQPSQTLVTIVGVDRLKIEGFVSAEQANSIRVGMPVKVAFSQNWINRTVPGKIVFVGPEANPVNLNVQVWVELENVDGKLMPGLRGDVLIEP
jgi:RND family efflux transporter MFP subunit